MASGGQALGGDELLGQGALSDVFVAQRLAGLVENVVGGVKLGHDSLSIRGRDRSQDVQTTRKKLTLRCRLCLWQCQLHRRRYTEHSSALLKTADC